MNHDKKFLEEILDIIVEDSYPEPFRLFFSDDGRKKFAILCKDIANLGHERRISHILGLLGAGMAFATFGAYKYIQECDSENIKLSAISRTPLPYIRPKIKGNRKMMLVDDCVYTGYNIRTAKNFLAINYPHTKISYYSVFNIFNANLGIGREVGKDFINMDKTISIDISDHTLPIKKLRLPKKKKVKNLKLKYLPKKNFSEKSMKQYSMENNILKTWNLFDNPIILASSTNLLLNKLGEDVGNKSINCVIASSPWSYAMATLISQDNDLPLVFAQKNMFKGEITYRPRNIMKDIESDALFPIILDTVAYTGTTINRIIDEFKKSGFIVEGFIPAAIFKRKSKEHLVSNFPINYLWDFEIPVIA